MKATARSGLEDARQSFAAAHRKTLRYCTTCPKMCRFACPVAHVEARETVTPWGLISLLHAATQGVVPIDESVADLVMRCTGCLECQTACRHQIDIPVTVYAGRAMLRAGGTALPWNPGVEGDAVGATVSDGTALGFVANSKVGFFAGCLERSTDTAALCRFAAMFRAVHVDVELIAGPDACCGAQALQAGDDAGYRRRARSLASQFARFDTVVTTCEDLVALCRHEEWSAPWNQGGASPRVLHWSEAMDEAVALAGIAPHSDGRELAYHDGCKLGRGAGVYDPPRALVRWATGSPPKELADQREGAHCCGAGAGYATVAPTDAADLAVSVHASAGGGPLVVASSRCAAHIEAAGGEVVRLEQLVATALGVK